MVRLVWAWHDMPHWTMAHRMNWNANVEEQNIKRVVPDSCESRGFRCDSPASSDSDVIGPIESVTSSVMLLPFSMNLRNMNVKHVVKYSGNMHLECADLWLFCLFAWFIWINGICNNVYSGIMYSKKHAWCRNLISLKSGRERWILNNICGHLLCAKILSISSRRAWSSECWSLLVNAFNSSSSREWLSAESKELVLNKLELSSGDFDRSDIRSKPQFNRPASMFILLPCNKKKYIQVNENRQFFCLCKCSYTVQVVHWLMWLLLWR